MAESTEPTASIKYSVPLAYLQQGDVFRIPTVVPFADTDIRLLRGADGTHGAQLLRSVNDADFEVLTDVELATKLAAVPRRTDWQVSAFASPPSNEHELVVVPARLSLMFVVASQSCDISGHDKKAKGDCVILPVRSLADLCRTELLPFQIGKQQVSSTIEDLLVDRVKDDWLRSQSDLEYDTAIRLVVDEWTPVSSDDKTLKGRIKNVINTEQSRGYLFWLKESTRPPMPTCAIDSTAMYTIPVSLLTSRLESRLSSIAPVYREQFARWVAERLGRVGTLEPISPDKMS